MARKWGFHSVVLASGASPLEVKACDDLAARLSADPERSSWQCACSYRVVRRTQLEDAVRATALADSTDVAEEEPPVDEEEATPRPEAVENAEVEAEPPEVAITALALASAFQQLVDRDKHEFEQFLADNEPSPGSGEGTKLLQSSATGFVSPEEGSARETPARVYLLLDYPSSLEEIDALLRLGEQGSDRTHSDAAAGDPLPLLPLIDGVLLLVDPLKGLKNRAKGLLPASRRPPASSTKFDELSVLDAFVPPSALPPSPFVTANPTISAFYKAAGVGGLEWSDFVFTDVACTRIEPEDAAPTQSKPADDLVAEVVNRIERLAADKFAFKGWVQDTKVYFIPSAEPQSDPTRRLLRKYHRVLRSSFAASVSVSTVVFALREAIARVTDDEENGVEDSDDEGGHIASQADSAQHLLGNYHQILSPSFRASASVSTVVFALREAVVRATGDEAKREETGDQDEPSPDPDRSLIDKYHRMLTPSFPASVSVSTVVFALREVITNDFESREQLIDDKEEEKEEEDPSELESATDAGQEFIEYGDEAAKRIARACICQDALRLEGDPTKVGGVEIAEVEKGMWQMSDLPGVGNNGRKAFPVVPLLSSVERGVLETEFASFCPPGLSVPQVHITRQLLQLEELLGTAWKGRVQTREFAELLNARVFPQRLAQVLLRAPTVHTSYYPPTDALLLACINTTAPGRFRTSFWSAREQVRHRPAFKDWKKERAVPLEYLTPRTAEAAKACVPLSSAELEAVAEKSWVFYPEDHSVVRLQQNPQGDTWLSVYQGRGVFGLRPLRLRPESEELPSSSSHAMQFTASFDDESRLHICEGRRQFPRKPDGFSTVTVTNAFPCGLSISVGSDGSIVQRYIRYDTESPGGGSREAEEYRVIYGRGCVLRVFGDGVGQILTPEGAVYSVVKQPNGSFQRVRPPQGSSVLTPPEAAFTVDPETNALVERRSTGVVIATHTDGARITYHVDGTRMYSNAQGTHVVVHKHGLADVAMDLTVNLTAQRHASGERVAVTKGGLRTRSTVTVYDGTRVDVAYNTKVTAQVNGRVTTTKPDGTVIIAKDSGRVEYVPSKRTAGTTSTNGGECNLPGHSGEEDNDRDVVNHNGVYYFDIRLGRFELCDREQNVFLIETGDGSAAPRASVDLAGVVSEAEAHKYSVEQIPAKATINDPIQPHVFILNGDGTALEVLSPREVADYLSEVSATGVMSALSKGHEKVPLHLPREFLASLVIMHPWSNNNPTAPVFNDGALARHLAGLCRPIATAGKYLDDYFAEFDGPRSRAFTLARRIWSLHPLSPEQVGQMQSAWSVWKQWQEEREATMDRFKIDDPRDADAIAQEAAVQKRVLLAYKAARDRRKVEREKAREMRLAAAGRGAQMEADKEMKSGGGRADAEDDDDFDQFASDPSDDVLCHGSGPDGGYGAEHLSGLHWAAFSQADDAGGGVLTVAQGTLRSCVSAFSPVLTLTHVSFDVFVDLVNHFKRLENGQSDVRRGDTKSAVVDSTLGLRAPAASASGKTLRRTAKPSSFGDARPVAVGSGARAARQRQALGSD